MEALLQYLIKSAAVLVLFFICFKTLLSNETFFTTKRVYLPCRGAQLFTPSFCGDHKLRNDRPYTFRLE